MKKEEHFHPQNPQDHDLAPAGPEEALDRAVEEAVVRAVLSHTPLSRRRFIGMLGQGTIAAMIAQFLRWKR